MKKLIVSMLLCFSVLSLFAQWQQIPGEGFDVGVSPNGTTWVIGSNHSIHRWNGTAWDLMPGEATRIDVDSYHNAWVVNQAGNIFTWVGGDWSRVQGSASDIGAGGGAVWAIGRTTLGGGFNIMRWNNGSWQDIPGAAVRIDVNQAGQAWVVNDRGDAFRWNGSTWVGAPGKQGRDISVGSDGQVFMVGWDDVGDGYPIYRWTGTSWTLVDGALKNISVGPNGLIWGTNSRGNIWRKGGIVISGRVMTSFDPQIQGFSFRNDFVSNFAGIDFAGLCAGMAYAALDYFNQRRAVPTQLATPALGTPLRQYIYDRQNNATVSNLDKWGELSFNIGGARTGEFFNWGLQGFGGGRLQELRAELDNGRPVPIGLYKGGNGGFNSHHVVLAVGYELGRYSGDLGNYKEDLRIYVYDSNKPGRTMILRPNPANQTYYYQGDPNCSWLTYFVDKKYSAASPPR